MRFIYANNVSTTLYEELTPNASEMRVNKLAEGLHWPDVNANVETLIPCTIVDSTTRVWEIVYVSKLVEGTDYDTLTITRGEEETGPASFTKGSRVEIRVTAKALNNYADAVPIPLATDTVAGLVKIGDGLNVTLDGTLSTAVKELPIATPTSTGVVKIGSKLAVDASGLINIRTSSLYKDDITAEDSTWSSAKIQQKLNAIPVIKAATSSTLGTVKPDDTTIKVDNTGTISVPVATKDSVGIVKVGDNISVDSTGSISVPKITSSACGVVKAGYNIALDAATGQIWTKLASKEAAGAVRPGTNINMDSDGILSVPTATKTTLGVVSAGANVSIDNKGAISVAATPVATTSTVGTVKPDNSTINIDSNGILSVKSSAIASFPAGTKMLFNQAAAPTGWVKQTSINDAALRVVSGSTGGAIGGANTFTTAFLSEKSVTLSGNVGSTTLTSNQNGQHRHFMINRTDTGSNTAWLDYAGYAYNDHTTDQYPNYLYCSTSGASQSHTHSLSGTAKVQFNVRYTDVIICSKS